ncbi:MAG: ferritin [bacterium]
MIGKKMQDAINKQINAETYSAYLYMSMSAYFESIGLKGFAHWMHMQAKEELIHALKFFMYINTTGGRVTLTAIAAPEKEWASPLAAFKAAYAHEVLVTSMIHALVDLAIKEKDHAANSLLQWYVAEQIEEEENASEIVNKLNFIGKDASALYMLDRELATRMPPVDVTAPGAGA